MDNSQELVSGKNNVVANVIRIKRSDFEVLEALACDSFIVRKDKKIDKSKQDNWGQIKPDLDDTPTIATTGTGNIEPGRR